VQLTFVKKKGSEGRIGQLGMVIEECTELIVAVRHFLRERAGVDAVVEEISIEFAFELLSHMKGGPSVEALLDLALSDNDDKDIHQKGHPSTIG